MAATEQSGGVFRAGTAPTRIGSGPWCTQSQSVKQVLSQGVYTPDTTCNPLLCTPDMRRTGPVTQERHQVRRFPTCEPLRSTQRCRRPSEQHGSSAGGKANPQERSTCVEWVHAHARRYTRLHLSGTEQDYSGLRTPCGQIASLCGGCQLEA